MLKVMIENYYSFSDRHANKHEFCTTMPKYQIFDWAKSNFRMNLRHEYWDNLGLLEIDINDNKSVIIKVKEIDSIDDIGDLNYIVKNKYIKTP